MKKNPLIKTGYKKQFGIVNIKMKLFYFTKLDGGLDPFNAAH